MVSLPRHERRSVERLHGVGALHVCHAHSISASYTRDHACPRPAGRKGNLLELHDPEGFAESFDSLRGRASYARISTMVSRATSGYLWIDPATLHRISKARHESLRSLDTPGKAAAFVTALMVHALLDEEQDRDEVLEMGQRMLASVLGDYWAELAFAEITEQADAISSVADLGRYLKACSRHWFLPEKG